VAVYGVRGLISIRSARCFARLSLSFREKGMVARLREKEEEKGKKGRFR
jgi:hypothetical protein